MLPKSKACGTAYGVGVGPGDPELMTLKAVRLIRENEIIALPSKEARNSMAYRIAVQSVPELREKTLLSLEMPMVRERAVLEKAHRAATDRVEEYLRRGQNVVFLLLGDPTVYGTFRYLRELLEGDGYPTETVSGVPSFCAAAARLNVPLAEWDESLHIIPAAHLDEGFAMGEGTYVFMKAGGKLPRVKALLRDNGRDVYAAVNCGMPEEALYAGVDNIPDDAGYFSLVIAKDSR